MIVSVPVYKILLIIPGRMMMNIGNNFKYAAKIVDALAWAMFLAANVLWTINYWKNGHFVFS